MILTKMFNIFKLLYFICFNSFFFRFFTFVEKKVQLNATLKHLMTFNFND